jgi:HPt (histidine-containing phosphotransfer) domain-containing protein
MTINREEIKRRRDFAKGQKYTMFDLRAEIAATHLATAHRLAHTLKSLAGLIGEDILRDIAVHVEQQLRIKKIPTDADLETLEGELNRVLFEIAESGILDEDSFNAPPALEEQTLLFNKLHNLLSENDAACIEYIDEIALIPETKVLIRQIENFAFRDALTTLTVLRDILEV